MVAEIKTEKEVAEELKAAVEPDITEEKAAATQEHELSPAAEDQQQPTLTADDSFYSMYRRSDKETRYVHWLNVHNFIH